MGEKMSFQQKKNSNFPLINGKLMVKRHYFPIKLVSMKYIQILFLCALSLPPACLWSQETSTAPGQGGATASISQQQETLSLQQSIDAALSKSDSNAILKKNLDISNALYRQTVAQNSVSLVGGIGYGYTEGFGSSGLLTQYSTTVGTPLTGVVPQVASGSLAFKGPSTSLSLAGEQIVSTGSVPVDQTVVGLSLDQNVWDGYPGGIAKANVQKSLLGLQSAQLSADSDRLNLVYQVKQAYYSMLNAQRSMDIYTQNLERQKAALEQEQALFDLQQAATVDLQTAQINVKSAEVDLKSGQLSLLIARKTLANLVGLPSDKEFVVAETEDPPIPAPSMDEAIAIGLSKRVELKQIQVSRKIADISFGLIKAQTSPTVDLTGGSYLLVDYTSRQPSAQTLSLGAKIGMPLLDSGSAAYQEAATRYQEDVLALQDDQYRRGIALDIENAYRSVELQKEKLDLSNLSAQNSVGQYELIKVERQYGTATNQDVLTAAVNMVNAGTAAAAARNSFDLSILQLQNVMGL
jgi:outer membrane protein TolC